MTCPSGKRRYPNLLEAEIALTSTRAAAVLRKNAGRERHETRAYACRRCSGWHLTSKPNRSTTHQPSDPRARTA